MNKFPLLYPLIGLTAGIIVSSDWLNGLHWGITIIGVAILIWLCLHIISKNPLTALKATTWHKIWILLLFAGIGSLDFFFNSLPKTEQNLNNKECQITGEINDISYLAEGDRFKLKVRDIKDSLNRIPVRNLFIILKTDGLNAVRGDLIKFRAKLREIDSSTPFGKRMKHQGVVYSANVKWDNIEHIDHPFSISNFFNETRENLEILVEKSSLPRNCSGFLISLLLGDKTFLDPGERLTLSSAGLAHILALSGLHVAILLSIILFLLFPLSLLGYSKARYTLALLFIWVYVLLTGCAASTLRAAIMASFVVAALMLERKNSSLNALFAAAIIILLFNPLALWDIGMQLSFVCVAAIILFANKLNPIDRHAHPKAFNAIGLVLISIVTSFSTWALTAYYFERVPLLFLGSNLILLPLLPIFIGSGLFYLLLLIFGIDFLLLSKFLTIFHKVFIEGATILSGSGNSVIEISTPSYSVVFWLFAIICLALAVYYKNRIRKGMALSAACICILLSLSFIISFSPAKTTNSLKFHHSLTQMEASLRYDDKETKLKFPRSSVSHMRYGDVMVTAIDQPLHPDSLHQITNAIPSSKILESQKATHLFLLIGPGSDLSQIAELIKQNDNIKVVMHPGIGKNKKGELLHLLDEKYWENIFSLKDSGSIEFEL